MWDGDRLVFGGLSPVDIVPRDDGTVVLFVEDEQIGDPHPCAETAMRVALALAHEMNASALHRDGRSREDFESTERAIRDLWLELVAERALGLTPRS